MKQKHSKEPQWGEIPASTRQRTRRVQKHIPVSEDSTLPSLPLMTIMDVAHHLKLSRATIYRLIAHEGLPTIHFGSAVRVDPTALRQWVQVQCDNKGA
jgi:excisionase family DNA binding protein